MNIRFLLAKHGNLTFQELRDMAGEPVDTTELQAQLSELMSKRQVKAMEQEGNEIVYALDL